jgi:hypothetical protein
MSGLATLGNMTFRVNPSQVYWEYSVDTAVIPTVGGRVVQVYGVTLGDMTVQGLFGEDRANRVKSWKLAENFQNAIAAMINQQGARPTLAQLSGVDTTPMHQPFRFTYKDATHNWDFNVYIKALKDAASGDITITHETGKYSYGYNLTLFIDQDNTGQLQKVAQDQFIARLSDGLGWQRTSYQGHMTIQDLQAYLQQNSPDGTIHGLILQEFENASQGQVPGYASANNPLPGGSSTANQITGG